MKKNISGIFFIIMAVMLLGSCSASTDEMNSADPATQCEPVSDILSEAEAGHHKELRVDGQGIVTWLSDKVTSMVRTASLKIYLKIALNLDFRFAVAIMMTLAVIIFTASVILGFTQANGYNALVFVLKLIIIYQLSINYYYFDVYVIESFEGLVSDAMMFSAFTFSDYPGATAQAICLGVIGASCDPVGILSSIFGLQAISDLMGLLGISTGPTLDITRITLFGGIDHQLSQFFNFGFWKLILTLALTGVTGFFWALMMFLMVITYFFAVVNAVKTFLMATIARYVLYGLGPIFISFALFNQTRSLFDGWLQQLISFSLQPIFVFIFLGMFHSILAGFTSKMYNDTSVTATKIMQQCNASDGGDCVKCTTCVGDVYQRPVTSTSKGTCIKWGKLEGSEDLNWYRLCTDQGCETNNGISPQIPVDIWIVISGVVICYLMGAMCHWVVDIANALAGGVVTLSDVKIQGLDRMKSQIGGGIKGEVNKMFANRGGGGRGVDASERPRGGGSRGGGNTA